MDYFEELYYVPKPVERLASGCPRTMAAPYPGKASSCLLLNRIRDHQEFPQRRGYTSFSQKRSTIDWIHGLRVLVKRQLEYRRGFLAAYFDFKKTFNLEVRRLLCDLDRFWIK